MQLCRVALDHPDAQRLIDRVQQEYVRRYGGCDPTSMDPAEFAPPRGTFLVGYLEGVPVACGGWRARDGAESGFLDGDAELKRMYVSPAVQRRGLARILLAELETDAATAGRSRLLAETGTAQPEAIALYRSCGYTDTDTFGLFRTEPGARCFAKPLPAPVPGGCRS